MPQGEREKKRMKGVEDATDMEHDTKEGPGGNAIDTEEEPGRDTTDTERPQRVGAEPYKVIHEWHT